MSAVKRVEFVIDRMPYTILRGPWYDIIILNVHVPTEDETNDMKDRFHGELEQVFDKLPKYHMKILLGDFNAKVGREDILKPTIGNGSLHEICNDYAVRVVNFATSKNLIIKSNFHIVAFINLLGHLLMGRYTIKLTMFGWIGEGIHV
jgi:hypothetical protein